MADRRTSSAPAVLYDGSGNAEATVGMTIATKCVLDFELVQIVHNKGGQPFKGEPLGKLPELWPFAMLKGLLVEHAHEFVRQIGQQSYHPLTNVEQFRVWGPFSEKVGAPRDFTPEATNQFIPNFAKREAAQVWGYQGEHDWHKGCAFVIQGTFTRHARHGYVDEQTGMRIV